MKPPFLELAYYVGESRASFIEINQGRSDD